MLGMSIGAGGRAKFEEAVPYPEGFLWDKEQFDIPIVRREGVFTSKINPRDLVDPAIWTGPAIHVDSAMGRDEASGLGVFEGDFSNAKKNIYAAFQEGNATGAPYRVIVKSGRYRESAFSKNGSVEPTQPVAIIGMGGPIHYRTGPFSMNWAQASGTHSTSISSVCRVFRVDQQTEHGHYKELEHVADPAICAQSVNSYAVEGGKLHVNIGRAPGPEDIAVMRGFHGARFVNHNRDLYLENLTVEGGLTGALHCDAIASRNIVGVKCAFRYSAPLNAAMGQDAVRVRRTNGLIAFFDSDASCGAKDGWNVHEDNGAPGAHIFLQRCTGFSNGHGGLESCNGFTTHDAVRAIVLDSAFGHSRNGTEIHCIQDTHSWLAGVRSTARDIDENSTAFHCSNKSFMWLDSCVADAAGASRNYALEANGGATVYQRDFEIVSGEIRQLTGGTINPY